MQAAREECQRAIGRADPTTGDGARVGVIAGDHRQVIADSPREDGAESDREMMHVDRVFLASR